MKKRNFKNYSELDYYNFARGTYSGVKGWFYWLCKPMGETEKKRFMERYTNVAFLTAQQRYAPELKSMVIFVGDKSFINYSRFVSAFKEAYSRFDASIMRAKPDVKKVDGGVYVSCTVNECEYGQFFPIA